MCYFGRRKSILLAACCIALMLTAITMWLLGRRDPKQLYELIGVGMTEDEIECIWEPPAKVAFDPLLDGKPLTWASDQHAGKRSTIKTIMWWWYDNEHVFEVYFDENAIAVYKSAPEISPPRSALGRLWRRIKELVE